MSSIESRSKCPTCGGKLRLNPKTKMYDCPYCGVSSDYKYLSAETANFRAAESLKRSEFHSAQKAYELKLKYDPRNFEALRGLILIAAKVKNVDELVSVDSYKAQRKPEVGEALERAKSECEEEHKAYFEQLTLVLNMQRQFPQTERDLTTLKESLSSQELALRAMEKKPDPDPYRKGPDKIEGLKSRIETNKVSIKRKEAELKNQRKRFEKARKELFEMDPLTDLSEAPVSESRPSESGSGNSGKHLKAHSCPTCGASLKVHIDRQEYECPFCGDVFDYQYVFEDDVIEKAKEYWSDEELSSAKKAYDFMLQKEPHNFRALRGLVLIAANMKSTEDLGNYYKEPSFRFPAGLVSVRSAEKACKKEHLEYFETMENLLEERLNHQKLMSRLKRLLSSRLPEYAIREQEEEEKKNDSELGPVASGCLTVFLVIFYVIPFVFLFGAAVYFSFPLWASLPAFGLLLIWAGYHIVDAIKDGIANHKYKQSLKENPKADPKTQLRQQIRASSEKVDELCKKLRDLDPDPEDSISE
ncbi:MAG: hypothetical protein IJL60_02845 [Clostridiales bacterium]|nr:hypothetical protein [Clostridiales bacterium]